MKTKPYRTIPRNFVFTCSFCGKPLTPSNNQKSRFEHFLNIYCSDACCNKNNRAKDAENRKMRKECGITGVSPKEKERLKAKAKPKNEMEIRKIEEKQKRERLTIFD